MGKIDDLEFQQRSRDETTSSSGIFCEICSMGLCKFASQFNFKCILVLILSASVFFSAVFLLFPFHSVNPGFDASQTIKMEATVQAYFRLEKRVLQLVPYIEQLEDELSGEVGVPDTKVTILSMHQSGAYNWTDVVFGVLPDPRNAPINPVSLCVLKLSLIDLFLRQFNLTLTRSIFGQPSSFEILKITGGITVIPVQSISPWQMPKMLFNFTLNNSVSTIQENLVELKQQLKAGLCLRSDENAYVQVTNEVGSTRNPPVTVQVTVLSDMGSLLPERLKQLAQIIQRSLPSENLGLNNAVFGKVNSVSLSSYLEFPLHSAPPAPSPAPFPEPPSQFSPHTPAPSAGCNHLSPSFNCDPFLSSGRAYPDAPSSQSFPYPPISNPRAPIAGTPTSSHPGLHSHQPTNPAFSPHVSTKPSCLDTATELLLDLAPLPSVYKQRHCKNAQKGVAAPMLSSASCSLSPFYLSSGLWLSSCITLTLHLLSLIY
ncbi:hypothetical protein Nepgr_026331 [Nepenthes gracilis]|uniref:DUF7036 domain-containing protein n=1 Tax=Nepenthes gracilis TaxID=150966 RepID=A0AAD3T7W9_NEPGR|nr:hypothetical protein Nepgr_026331 [Nepenthes gracilis]